MEVAMHARERIIRERFAQQRCQECGSPYEEDGILVLARRRSTWMVLVTCKSCEHRGIFVVSFPSALDTKAHDAKLDLAAMPEALADTANVTLGPAPQRQQGPVTLDEVNQMRDFLDRFDGNFHRLFVN
jgi:hypothetical protein